jgi:hypothetical protein
MLKSSAGTQAGLIEGANGINVTLIAVLECFVNRPSAGS